MIWHVASSDQRDDHVFQTLVDLGELNSKVITSRRRVEFLLEAPGLVSDGRLRIEAACHHQYTLGDLRAARVGITVITVMTVQDLT